MIYKCKCGCDLGVECFILFSALLYDLRDPLDAGFIKIL